MLIEVDMYMEDALKNWDLSEIVVYLMEQYSPCSSLELEYSIVKLITEGEEE